MVASGRVSCDHERVRCSVIVDGLCHLLVVGGQSDRDSRGAVRSTRIGSGRYSVRRRPVRPSADDADRRELRRVASGFDVRETIKRPVVADRDQVILVLGVIKLLGVSLNPVAVRLVPSLRSVLPCNVQSFSRPIHRVDRILAQRETPRSVQCRLRCRAPDP